MDGWEIETKVGAGGKDADVHSACRLFIQVRAKGSELSTTSPDGFAHHPRPLLDQRLTYWVPHASWPHPLTRSWIAGRTPLEALWWGEEAEMSCRAGREWWIQGITNNRPCKFTSGPRARHKYMSSRSACARVGIGRSCAGVLIGDRASFAAIEGGGAGWP